MEREGASGTGAHLGERVSGVLGHEEVLHRESQDTRREKQTKAEIRTPFTGHSL